MLRSPLLDLDLDLNHVEPQLQIPTELQCYCGKVFSQQSALTNHSRSCKPSKTRFASALTIAKEAWEARKRKRREKIGEVVQPLVVEDSHNSELLLEVCSLAIIHLATNRDHRDSLGLQGLLIFNYHYL